MKFKKHMSVEPVSYTHLLHHDEIVYGFVQQSKGIYEVHFGKLR